MLIDRREHTSTEPAWDLFEDAVQELVEQAHRGQYEVVQGHTTSREPANGYAEFLESLFLNYRQSVRTTESREEEEGKVVSSGP